MKTVSIAKISVNNPMLASYVKTIRSWDHGENFEVVGRPFFYGVFLDEKFLAASTMQFDKETADVQISMINGSIQNYDMIQEESTKELVNIAYNDYKNAKTVSMNYVKRISK